MTIRSKPANKAYRQNYDQTFKTRPEQHKGEQEITQPAATQGRVISIQLTKNNQ